MSSESTHHESAPLLHRAGFELFGFHSNLV
jgi:hypothetical protein